MKWDLKDKVKNANDNEFKIAVIRKPKTKTTDDSQFQLNL